jgi:hypothetical protein
LSQQSARQGLKFRLTEVTWFWIEIFEKLALVKIQAGQFLPIKLLAIGQNNATVLYFPDFYRDFR